MPITTSPHGVENVRLVGTSGYSTLDHFNRLEVAEAMSLGDYIHRYNLSPLLFDATVVGGAAITHLPNESSVQLTTSTASGDSAIFSSRRYHRYQAGKAGSIILTCVPGAKTANVVKRFGLFDASNGFFFSVDGSNFSVNIRTYTSGSPVDTQVTQSNFNGDKVDGTGASGVTIDLTKANIFQIDFQWLGVGLVTFSMVKSDGSAIVLHQIRNANANAKVYMTTASLPVRFEQVTTSTASSVNLIAICSSVVSSGGEEPPELQFGFGNTSIITTSSASETPLAGFRLATTFNSIANRQLVLPQAIELASNLGPALFRVYLNSTITGGSWVAVNANSCVEYNITISSVTPGIPLLFVPIVVTTTPAMARSAFAAVGLKKLALSLNAAGSSSDNILITVTRMSATDVEAMASLAWGELR